jgi:hypothetical protein
MRRIPYGRNLGFLDRTSLEHSHKVLHYNILTKYFNRTLSHHMYITVMTITIVTYYTIKENAPGSEHINVLANNISS